MVKIFIYFFGAPGCCREGGDGFGLCAASSTASSRVMEIIEESWHSSEKCIAFLVQKPTSQFLMMVLNKGTSSWSHYSLTLQEWLLLIQGLSLLCKIEIVSCQGVVVQHSGIIVYGVWDVQTSITQCETLWQSLKQFDILETIWTKCKRLPSTDTHWQVAKQTALHRPTTCKTKLRSSANVFTTKKGQRNSLTLRLNWPTTLAS